MLKKYLPHSGRALSAGELIWLGFKEHLQVNRKRGDMQMKNLIMIPKYFNDYSKQEELHVASNKEMQC